MKRNKNNQFIDHPRPVTRRDFLSRGGYALTATLMAPSLIGKLARANSNDPASCAPPGNADNFIPMLVFDCNGGAALPGNFLVGGTGGPEDLLPSYNTMGWDPRAAGALDTRFGLPMAAKLSQILAGIVANASPAAQANFRMGSFCHASQDDSQINLTSSLILAIEHGVSGSIIQRGLGVPGDRGANASGGNSSAVDQSSAFQPVAVTSVNDVLNAVSMGPALDALPLASRRSLLMSMLSMSKDQLGAISGGAPGAFGDQMFCAYQNASNYTDAGKVLDPRNDTNISKVYGLNAQTAANSPDLIAASVAMNVLKKQSGPGVITINGWDYHDGSQSTGDGIDLSIGIQIGRALEAAHLLQTPLFVQIITDGGIFADTDTRNWGGDSGDKGMTVIGYYNPKAVPTLLKPASPQIGAYNVGQGADQSTLIGADTGKVAYATFANYLQICGTLSANTDIFSNVFGNSLNDVLLFG